MRDPVHPTAQHGFCHAAENYHYTRPDYPQDIVDWLNTELHLNSLKTVIDLGSGTGKFLPYLKQSGAQIIAVEPLTQMLEQLHQQHEDITILQASSEHIPLYAHHVDAVVCAQSFHWFANQKSLQEISRILKPQGYLGLIWNQRDTSITWVNALHQRLLSLEGNTPRYHSGEWSEVFKQENDFILIGQSIFQHHHKGTVEHVVSQRLLSTSFIAALPLQKQLELKAEFEDIVYQYTQLKPKDIIQFPYQTYVYAFQKQR